MAPSLEFDNLYRLADAPGPNTYVIDSNDRSPGVSTVLIQEQSGPFENDELEVGETIEVSRDGGVEFNRFVYVGEYAGGVVYTRNNRFFLATNDIYVSGETINAALVETPVCFLPGTLISTPGGSLAVESLKPGDLVLTPHGAQAVKFLAFTTCRLNSLRGIAKMPIRIQAGALGQLGPEQDTYMSPSHAIHFEGHLVEAGALVNGESVCQVQEWADSDTITYFNIELDEHELIWANGMMVESYFSSYRTNGFSRESWDNYSEYLALYGSSELITELDMPRIPFARQLPMSLRLLLQLNEPSQQDEAHPVAEALSL